MCGGGGGARIVIIFFVYSYVIKINEICQDSSCGFEPYF